MARSPMHSWWVLTFAGVAKSSPSMTKFCGYVWQGRTIRQRHLTRVFLEKTSSWTVLVSPAQGHLAATAHAATTTPSLHLSHFAATTKLRGPMGMEPARATKVVLRCWTFWKFHPICQLETMCWGSDTTVRYELLFSRYSYRHRNLVLVSIASFVS